MVLEMSKKHTLYHFLIEGCKIVTLVTTIVLSTALPLAASSATSKLIQEAKEAIESADPFMGDWQGSWKLNDGSDSGPLASQVIALGKGQYQLNLLEEFDRQGIRPIAVLTGRREDSAVRFAGKTEYRLVSLQIEAVIQADKLAGKFQGQDADGQQIAGTFEQKKVIRLSPTLGAKPPAGAIVLFDGKSFDEWNHAKKEPVPVQWKLANGAMEVKPGSSSIITKKKFTDFKLHLEFRTPFMPESRGQARGNSGVYLQGRYEVQILDSYGLEGKDNECGGIYRIAPPKVNMCAPPMQWQTYDITFYAPHFDSTDNKIKNARLTVLHNGVKIHEDVEVPPKPTTAAADSNVTEPGGIYLQDHGNTVQFRNIWLQEL